MGFLKKIFGKKNEYDVSTKTGDEPSVFVEDEYTIQKVNGKITDDDVPSLIRVSYESKMLKNKHMSNDFKELLPKDRDKYHLNDDEIKLLKEFYEQFKKLNKKPQLYVGRMADGALDMSYKGCPFGRARLQGKKHMFQYYMGLNGRNKVIEGEVDDFIPYVEKWVKYIKNYL